MLSVDHSNIDGPPLAVKCVRKFGSALGGEVTSVCVCVCMRMSKKMNLNECERMYEPERKYEYDHKYGYEFDCESK